MLETVLRPRGAASTIVVIDEQGACDNYSMDRLDLIVKNRQQFDRLDELDAAILQADTGHIDRL